MTKRWSATQHLVAAHFVAAGWPFAEAVGTGRGGTDVTGVPGVSVEVKSTGTDEPRWRPWMAQAAGHPGVSFVVWRGPGMGPSSVGQWQAILPLADLTALLRAAGYGGG